MYNTILLPLALDQGHGLRYMEIARRLRAEGSKIIAVNVIDQIPNFAKYYLSSDKEEEIHEAAEKAIAERIGREKDAEAVVLTGHPGRTITDYAECHLSCTVEIQEMYESILLRPRWTKAIAARISREKHAEAAVLIPYGY